MTCPKCGSEEARENRAHTIFCMKCWVCTSRSGNLERMYAHPLYQVHGPKIKPTHPDSNEFRFENGKARLP